MMLCIYEASELIYMTMREGRKKQQKIGLEKMVNQVIQFGDEKRILECDNLATQFKESKSFK